MNIHKITVPPRTPIVLCKQHSNIVFHLNHFGKKSEERLPIIPRTSYDTVEEIVEEDKATILPSLKQAKEETRTHISFNRQNFQKNPPRSPPVESKDITDFHGPMKSNLFFTKYKKYLTEKEKVEIHRYAFVYYLRKKEPEHKGKKKKVSSEEEIEEKEEEEKEEKDANNKSFFKFVEGEHIGYRYEQVAILGHGSFGSVVKCIDHKTGQFVAIKTLRNTKKVQEELKLEMQILKHLQMNGENSHIAKYIDFLVFRGFFCIVMELLSESLSSAIRNSQAKKIAKESLVYCISRQLAYCIQFIHNAGVIHCDIKPDNILFTNFRKTSVRLIDFGCSCYEGQTIYSYIQTRYYRAPEIVLNLDYNTKIDIWSLGCVIYEMCTGVVLFPAESEEELFNMMVERLGLPSKQFMLKCKKKVKFIENETTLSFYKNSHTGKTYTPGARPLKDDLAAFDQNFVDFIYACLTIDPKERKTMNDIVKMPFFQN